MEQTLSAKDLLDSSILLLEKRQMAEWALLKEETSTLCEDLKPLNLVKNAFKDLTSSPDIKNDLLGMVLGLGAGYLSKKIMVGASHNPVKKLLGFMLELGISKIVSKNPEPILSLVNNVTRLLTKRKIAMNGSGYDYVE